MNREAGRKTNRTWRAALVVLIAFMMIVGSLPMGTTRAASPKLKLIITGGNGGVPGNDGSVELFEQGEVDPIYSKIGDVIPDPDDLMTGDTGLWPNHITTAAGDDIGGSAKVDASGSDVTLTALTIIGGDAASDSDGGDATFVSSRLDAESIIVESGELPSSPPPTPPEPGIATLDVGTLVVKRMEPGPAYSLTLGENINLEIKTYEFNITDAEDNDELLIVSGDTDELPFGEIIIRGVHGLAPGEVIALIRNADISDINGCIISDEGDVFLLSHDTGSASLNAKYTGIHIEPPSLSLSATAGYAPFAPEPITVTNNSGGDLDEIDAYLQTSIDGVDSFFEITVSENAIDDSYIDVSIGDSVEFYVKPYNGLQNRKRKFLEFLYR